MNKKELVDKLIANGVAESEREKLEALSEDTLKNMVGDPDPEKDPKAKEGEGKPKEEKDPKTDPKEEDDPKDKGDVPAPKADPEGNTEKPVTAEEYIAKAPAEIRDMLGSGLMAHQAEKAKLVKTVLANEQNRFTEEMLNLKGLGELQALAALAAKPETRPTAPLYLGQGEPAAPVGNAEEPLAVPAMEFGKE